MALFDLFGKQVKVGDKVVVGKDWARDCDYLVVGIVKQIKETKAGTYAIIEKTHSGEWRYGKDTTHKSLYNKQFVYKNVGREHNNLLIIQ